MAVNILRTHKGDKGIPYEDRVYFNHLGGFVTDGFVHKDEVTEEMREKETELGFEND